MKKTMIALLALLIAASVFAGCEVRNPMYNESSAVSATAEPSSEPEPTEAPSEAPSEVSETESSLNSNTSDLLTALTGESDEEKIAAYVRLYGKTAEETANALYDEELMQMKLEARGKAIVYVTQVFFMESDEDGTFAAGMEATIDAQDATFQSIVTSLQAAGVKEPSVIIEYLDNNGGIMYSKEYK